jgi:hypothetical protein
VRLVSRLELGQQSLHHLLHLRWQTRKAWGTAKRTRPVGLWAQR